MQNDQSDAPSNTHGTEASAEAGSLHLAALFAALTFLFVLGAMSAHLVGHNSTRVTICIIMSLLSAFFAVKHTLGFIKNL